MVLSLGLVAILLFGVVGGKYIAPYTDFDPWKLVNTTLYTELCESPFRPDIPCHTFWRSDLKDANVRVPLPITEAKIPIAIKDKHLSEYAILNTSQTFSIHWDGETTLQYVGINQTESKDKDEHCFDYWIGASDNSQNRGRLVVSDEPNQLFWDTKHPAKMKDHFGESNITTCEKWIHVKVWYPRSWI